jgi:hypothetical protein
MKISNEYNKRKLTFCEHRKEGQISRPEKIYSVHSQPEKCRKELVRIRKEIDRVRSARGVLTSWTRQMGGLVRTRKETERARGTHQLGTAEGVTCQDTKTNRPSEGHSRPEDGRGSDLSGHGKEQTKRGALTPWRRQREKLVRTQKETERARGTHFLEMAEGGTCQDTERNRPNEAHSPTGDDRGRDLSRHGNKPD